MRKFKVVYVLSCEDFPKCFSPHGGLEWHVTSFSSSSRRAASMRASRAVRMAGGFSYVIRRVKGGWSEVEEHCG